MSRRLATVVYGALPVLVSLALVGADSIPVLGDSLRVPYAAEGPGPVFNTLGDYEGKEIIDISGTTVDDTTGELNMTTVSVVHNMTFPQVVGRWMSSNDTFIPLDLIIPPGQTADDVQQSSEQAFSTAESAATQAAFTHLGLPVDVVVHKTVDGSGASGVINDGDVIVSVDDKPVATPTEVTEMVKQHKPGDVVKMGVRRNGTDRVDEVEFTLGKNSKNNDAAFAGLLLMAQPAGGVDVNYNLSGVGGPSAGLIFSLAVIDKLSPGELTGGHNVAGTGTMAPDGTVGPIGGISHKVQAAKDAGAELFLSPTQNCAEAIADKPEGIVVAKVDTLDDAIKQLEAFNKGESVEECSTVGK